MSVLNRIRTGLKRAKPGLPVLANGIIMVDDEKFAAIAAIHENGDCFVATGYQHKDVFREGRQRLLDAQQIPETGTIKNCSLETIRALYQQDNAGHPFTEAGAVEQTQGHRQLEATIAAAAEARASDLKIYLRDSCTEVRIKAKSREFDYGRPWTVAEGIEAINYAFDAQDKGAGETTLKRAGRQSFSISSREKLNLPSNVVKLRCQTGPHEGDAELQTHLVMRLFYKNDRETGALEDLGFDAEVMGKLAQVRANLRGGIIIGGETGDGKSTSLIKNAERLYDEHDEQISLVTLEDPVEFRLRRSGIIQVPLNSAGDEDDLERHYRQALRHFLRINPDVGIISEIRDGTSARKVLDYIRSGHQLFATVHVESANGIPFRLVSMGVPSEELAHPGLIRLLIKQTLVPLLCDHCKRPLHKADLGARDKALVAPLRPDAAALYLRNPDGCRACRRETNEIGRLAWWGYQREIAVGEVIEPDISYLKFVRDRDSIGALEHWLRPRGKGGMGGISIGQKMTELALNGRVDPRDVVLKRGDLSQRMSAVQRADLKWGEA
ncbi:ATPase, T2SS/T4P/T4SS family [Ruegeria atlantica]|uniref:ATPase, T2SS/T4P/T4SS family n=1 Tax=Ruegeria atlantica TaxID=81569 RepID=UPI0014805750|nr:ATPase, T2SS/T4P/T4SS family [Ruegeria atlantica]